MAKITLDISIGSANEPPLITAAFFRQLTDTLVRWNQTMLPRWKLPPLYEAGVRYVAKEVQDLPDALAIRRARNADCGPLSAWRVAELRLQGEPAALRIYWRPISNGQRLFHAQVRRASQCPMCGAVQQTGCPPTPGLRFARCQHCGRVAVPWGKIEDPSRLLGMPTHG